MKESKQCPKCFSMLITGPHYTNEGYIFYDVNKKHIGASFGKTTPILAYVCMNCGFVEFYTTDEGTKKLKEHVRDI